MRHTTLFLFIIALPFLSSAQIFENQWKEVDRLIEIKNYKEIQPIIASIKAQAKASDNSPAWIRAVLAEHHALTTNMTKASAFYDIQQHFLAHITESNPQEQKVLQNLYASFLAQNIYENRVESDPAFLSWDGEKRKAHIDTLFVVSLSDKTTLALQPIEQWKTMVDDLKNQTLAPTVYHLMAYNYLGFLEAHYPQDSVKHQLLIQSLQETNQENNYTDAYAYLAFRPYATAGPWKIREQEKEIQQLLGKQKTDYNAYILLQLANAHYTYGDRKKAVNLLHTTVQEYPNSPWIKDVKSRLDEWTKASLSIQIAKNTPSQVYTPIIITAQNTDRTYIRVYNTTNTPNNFKAYKTEYDSLSHTLSIEADMIYEEAVQLTSFDDYNSHTTNYKINPLPYGNYKILIANNPQFRDDKQDLTVSQAELVVSDIFVSPTIDKEDDDGYTYRTVLLDRKTGLPYSNKTIALYEDSQDGVKQTILLTSNAHGEFSYTSSSKKKNENLEHLYIYIAEEKQLIELVHVHHIPTHSGSSQNENETIENKGIIITDRAIYRPGQEVFFKAILHTDDRLSGKIIPNHDVKVVLKDANRQPVDTVRLSTNTYGSVHGSFRVPQRTLNGWFQIELLAENNRRIANHSISVEEYKRPTFRVSFDENQHTYTKQDTGVFTGTVESLSGAKLSHIPVRYTVRFYTSNTYPRNVRYLDDTVSTDQDGKFTFYIPFGDTTFRHTQNIDLQFEAEAINETGEIQTTSGTYRYSDNPLRISIFAPAQVMEGNWNNVVVKTSNPNGHPLPAKGVVNIYKYATPDIIQSNQKTFDFRTEYHILDTADYQHYFPWYFDKQDLLQEKAKTLVGTYDFDSADTDTVRFGDTAYPYGSYHIEAYAIQGADTIRSERLAQVRSKDENKISDMDFLTVRLDQPDYTIGGQATIHFQTDFEEASGVYLWKVQGSTKNPVTYIPYQGGLASYTHLLSESDIRHNTWFEAMMVQENKIVTRQLNIPIVRTDKSLDIRAQTFRDKITPGQTEKWSFTIKNKDTAVSSEVLATMYDTALDQFRAHSFPHGFAISSPYRWTYVRSGWNIHHFNQQTQSEAPWIKRRPQRPNSFEQNPPLLKSYGLWPSDYIYYGKPNRLFKAVALDEEAFADLNQTRRTVVEESLSGQAAGITIRGSAPANGNRQPLYVIDGKIAEAFDPNQIDQEAIQEISVLKEAEATAIYGTQGANGVVLITTKEGYKLEQLNQVQARRNLQETAFFYPTLLTDKDGNITVEFESPEALTKWKLMLFAHTEDLEAGSATFFTQTQKQLMVRPNLPRFMREGDEIVIKSQIQNLSDNALSGTARLEVIDPETNDVISPSFFEDNGLRDFSVDAEGNTVLSWTLHVPQGYPVVQIRVVGATTEFSDGELHELPILPNRILVTDTEKIILNSGQQKDYNIPTVGKDNVQLKVQVQSNPILEIIAALDYLKNYPYECNEQIASKWYGMMMLQYIEKHYPAISDFFNSIDPDETQSKLEENSSLSELLNEEMPWVRQIQNDKKKVQSLANLFRSELTMDIRDLEDKLLKNQAASGSFSWFDGGKPDTRISIRLLEVFGKVAQLDRSLLSDDVMTISQKLIGFLDTDTTIYQEKATTGLVLDYLYTRALWNDYHVLPALKTEQLRKYIDLSARYTAKQPAGLAAKAWLVNAKYDYRIASIEVKNRIEQEVIYDTERGMYWESNERPYNSMSLQSYLVEAYQELDPTKVDQITQWIYYSKQHNNWLTTWNTVDAVYALLLANNPNDFTLDNTVDIRIDQQPVETSDKVLGQVSTALSAEELGIEKTISITNHNSRKVYGGIYHQYFAPLEAVRSSQKELSIEKKFFIEKGNEWVETTNFKSGEKIKVQLTVVNNEPLHYVHLKDNRAAGFEPIYQPSGYRWWQGYYFTIKDASTNYFFDYLPQGRHVYEYEVKTNNTGVFHSGISQIECMYEPTVNARSGNSKVRIEK